jgi:hypothetical protein
MRPHRRAHRPLHDDPSSIQGDTVFDVSDSGNNAEFLGFGSSPTIDAGPSGPALDFPDSGAGCLSVPGQPLDTGAGHMNSFAFWYWRSSQPPPNDVLVYAPDTNAPNRFDVWLIGSKLCFPSPASRFKRFTTVPRADEAGARVHAVRAVLLRDPRLGCPPDGGNTAPQAPMACT